MPGIFKHFLFTYFIILQTNQSDLEMATEHLSEFLERDMNTDEMKTVQEIKQKVQDKYRLVIFYRCACVLYVGNNIC